MSTDVRSTVTHLLRQIADGDRKAINELYETVYEDLRATAQRLMRRERPDHTLQPTALVNEAVARLLDSDLFTGTVNRAIFFGAATNAMRRVLVDHARRRSAAKRGKGWERSPWDDAVVAFERETIDLEQLDAALNKLERLDRRQYEIIQLRFFGGLPVAEIAELMTLSHSSVEKELRKARAFLYGELRNE